MTGSEQVRGDVLASYRRLRPQIDKRLASFDRVWTDASEEDLFAELVFCIFTPQSSAARCWEAVEDLRGRGFLQDGGAEEISEMLCRVRFRHTKARRVIAARALLEEEGALRLRRRISGDPREAREWLVSNVDGIGYKEASHFLRNVGRGRGFAILDRHILLNLAAMDVIPDVPRTMTPGRYMAIEGEMASFSDSIGIPLAALDLVLWHRQTGWMFK
ncbi:MAG: N-glycosylase/DNA lyase [Thermoplasmata archaeon]|nr:N-glycosylase/DNA lyase [Thermoplasmata archaeon]